MPQNRKLFTLGYFAPISWYSAALSDGENILEYCDNYQKQSFRNRCVIASPNGPMPLVIPVIHDKTRKLKYREIEIDERQNWRQVHRKSLEAAYRNSAFYPFFEDEIADLYHEKNQSLFDFNLRCHQLILRMTRLKLTMQPSSEWVSSTPNSVFDLRDEIHPKKPSKFEHQDPYPQTFSHKLGFLPDLSILDVVFNLGLESVSYLRNNISNLKL